jgi:hypothetical protein
MKHAGSFVTTLAGTALFLLGAVSTAHLASVKAAPQISPQSPNVAAGQAEASKLLLLMDKDKSGKVSRQEYMDFMTAEFERMDINHDGELDVKELTQSQLVQAPHTGYHR